MLDIYSRTVACTCSRVRLLMNRKNLLLSNHTCMYTQDLMPDIGFELKIYLFIIFLLIHLTNYLRSTLVQTKFIWWLFRIATFLQYHAWQMVYRVSSHVDTWAHLELITCCVHSNIFVLFSLKTIQIRMHMQVQCVVSYERPKTTHVRACLEERLILLLAHADISFVQSRAWAITSQFHAQPWSFHRSLCVHAQSAKTKDCFARTRKFSEKTCADTRFYGIHVWLGRR